ncbi:hypothetical protein AB0451_03575 [Streptomyces sp. NPDC052000]|uniref:hypothetical protein n=1 Tax=Streptomyces sp. NPDC052000 TaxID=3155676 RepID=UPI00344D9BF7
MSIARTPEAQALIKAIDRSVPAEAAVDLLLAFRAAVARETRADVLREVYGAIEDPARRAAVGGGLGWETARDVVHNLLRSTTGGLS